MKQPEDNKTAELDLVAKRGRGRPALEHALTPSERAKRYRDAKRAKRAAGATPVKQEHKSHDGKAPTTEITSGMYWNTLQAWKNELQVNEHLAKALLHAKDEASTLRTQLDLSEHERNAAFKANEALKIQLRDASQKNNAPEALRIENAELKEKLQRALDRYSQEQALRAAFEVAKIEIDKNNAIIETKIEKIAKELRTTKAENKRLKTSDNLKKAAEREKELNRENTLLLLQLNKLRDASQK